MPNDRLTSICSIITIKSISKNLCIDSLKNKVMNEEFINGELYLEKAITDENVIT
jgi:hypothetical protein